MNFGMHIFYFVVFPGFIFTFIMGLLFNWIDRKLSARVQWRVGPPFFQPLWDFLKLLAKDTYVPEDAPKFIYLISPLLALSGVVIFTTLLGVSNMFPLEGFLGDLIVALYFLSFFPVWLIIAGSSSSNPLSGVGVSREMALYFAYELPFLLGIFTVILKSGGELRIGNLLLYQWKNGSFLYSWSGFLAFVVVLFSMQAKLGLVPFDIGEAEQEIMTGSYAEFSGPVLGAWRLAKFSLFYGVVLFIVMLFWSGIRYPWDVFKVLGILVVMVLLRQTNPRLRIDQALKFFWIWMLILGIIALLLAVRGY